MAKRYRFQFVLDESSANHIEELMYDTRVATKTQFFNDALTLLEWAIRQRREGRIIASLDGNSDTYRELSMPILEAVATTTR